jgi:glutathione S-transferase
MSKAVLYGLPISHPVRAARMMLDYKGIPYKRVDFPNGIHAGVLRVMGFPSGTAPALKIDGRKVQTTLEISRELDRIEPDPPLFPTDPAERERVVRAERWGNDELQPIPRQIAVPAFERDRSTLPEFMADANLAVPLPPRVVIAAAKPMVMIQRWRNQVSEAASREAIARIPACLDHVEALLDDGVIGGEQPNAADFQVAASVRVLLVFDDLRPLIDGRPAARHARRIVPEYPGHINAVLPQEWLAPLRQTASV